MATTLHNKLRPVLLAIAGSFLVTELVCEVVPVEGQVFQPRGADSSALGTTAKSLVLVDRFSPKFCGHEYNKSDRVLLRDPRDPHRRIVRRVVAKTNNWVRIYDRYGGNNIFVPSGYSWVQSEEDSNPWETDSRDFGPVPLGIIEGLAVCVLWPPSRIGFIKNQRGEKKQA